MCDARLCVGSPPWLCERVNRVAAYVVPLCTALYVHGVLCVVLLWCGVVLSCVGAERAAAHWRGFVLSELCQVRAQ